MVDSTKLAIRGLSLIGSVVELSNVLAHGLSAGEATMLQATGATVELIDPLPGEGRASA